ncbi:energy transducer TonB [Flavobacterium caeni]|uniref:Protein TonB n=1 Tax=Flavobacterium caeni TaxID=490189 RepID=A0A1G5JU21_9FLAO|nr:energy transducer TonB [Flavobacterium caeni]SCY91893.1 protein TonB [Flavobacterium caeni]
MKHVFLFLMFLATTAIFAQDENFPVEETVYRDSIVDVQPEFPGGIDEFYKFFYAQFKKPNVPSFVDKIMLSFVVEKDGSIDDVRIVHDAGFGTADQAVEIVRQSPRWTPGSKDGQPVRVLHTLPIAVVTED